MAVFSTHSLALAVKPFPENVVDIETKVYLYDMAYMKNCLKMGVILTYYKNYRYCKWQC